MTVKCLFLGLGDLQVNQEEWKPFSSWNRGGQLLLSVCRHVCQITLQIPDGSKPPGCWKVLQSWGETTYLSLWDTDSEYLLYASPQDLYSRRKASNNSVLEDWEETKWLRSHGISEVGKKISEPLAGLIWISWRMVAITGNCKTANVERKERKSGKAI